MYIKLISSEENKLDWRIMTREILLEVYKNNLQKILALGRAGLGVDNRIYYAIHGKQTGIFQRNFLTLLFSGWANSMEFADKKILTKYINKCICNKRKYKKTE